MNTQKQAVKVSWREDRMKTLSVVMLSALLSVPALSARADGPKFREYSRAGEVSPGTQAPTLEGMVEAIKNGSIMRLKATLEYGERVLCEECVPLLHARLLDTADDHERELAAWWLRRQPFAAPGVLADLRVVVKKDASAVHRARAAHALGEMMDPGSLPVLQDAALEDKDASVRAAGVRALARLNSAGAAAVLGDVLADSNHDVRIAALEVLIHVGAFRDYEMLLPLLGDSHEDVRARAARLLGEHRVSGAESMLIVVLRGDQSSAARAAAAWALGRIGGAAGRDALIAAPKKETNEQVLDAIEIAGRMPARS
jgi:HEAT repeat protein